MNGEDQYLGHIYQRFPVNIARGKGAKVWDTSDREYIDCMGGYGVAIVGHCNERVVVLLYLYHLLRYMVMQCQQLQLQDLNINTLITLLLNSVNRSITRLVVRW